MKNVLAFIGWLALPLAAGVVGALSTNPGDWYNNLTKPEWTPPKFLFGPVWTTLYVMMGIAAFLVWKRRNERPVGLALTLFVVQLVINAVWSPLFFGIHRPDYALIDIAILWVLVVATLIAFFRVRTISGVMLIPYLIWVSYATALNFSIWQNNPAGLIIL